MPNSDPTTDPYVPAPLTKDELPAFMWDRDPTEGDENGPFLVRNKTGDILDRRNYGGWVAPEYGDGYSDSRSDYVTDPE